MVRVLFTFLAVVLSLSIFAADEHAPVWSQDRKAKAFCDTNSQTVCYVLCNDQLVNVSLVEKGNLGKIEKYDYQKVITFPTRWESNDEVGCLFWFSTQAWIDGQRHTASEPVWVKGNEYIQR